MIKLSKNDMKQLKGGTTYNLEYHYINGGGGGFPYGIKVCKCNIVQPYNYFLGENPTGTQSQTQTANADCSGQPGYKDCKMWV